MKKFAVVTAAFITTLPHLVSARERACCRYSCQQVLKNNSEIGQHCSALFHPQGSVECPDYCDDSFSCVIKGPTNVFVTESKCEVKAFASVRSSFKIVTNVLLD